MTQTVKHYNALSVIAITVTALMSVGCSSVKKQDETLGSLTKRSIQVNPQTLPQVGADDAKESYQQFLSSTSNEELKARAMERLADIQLESHQDQKIQSSEQRENQLKSAQPNVSEAVVDPSGLQDYASVAAQYEKLLARYPDGKDNDQTMYQLARAYDLSGQPEKSLEVMNRLIKQYPNTPHMEEIQFRRGEIYFSLKKYPQAEDAYVTVLSNKDSTYYERALYKHGWALFKENELQKALNSFYRLLDLHFDAGRHYDEFSNTEKELVNDAIRVICLSYSFQDGPESIKAFSASFGERIYEGMIYSGLGELYEKQERFKDAASTYASYAEAYPNSAEAPLFLVRVIKIFERSGFTKALSDAKADFVTRYGVNRPYWSRHERQLFDEVAPYIKSNLSDLARHYHAQAQKSKKPNDYKIAAHWYREFVTSFPSDPESAQMSFLLAETLLETKDYAAAAAQYEKTAYDYPVNEKSAEAGYAALLAHQKIIASLEGDKQKAYRHETTQSALRFANAFPNDKRTPSVLLKAAEELLDLKRMGEASATASQVIANKSKEAQPLYPAAWAVVASAEFDLKHYKAAEEASLQRLKLSPADDKDRKVHEERLAAAIYKQGEEANAQGQYQTAADTFLRIAKVVPAAAIRPTAEYDAAAALALAGNWKGSIAVLTAFIAAYPQHEFVNGAREKLAVAYEKDGDWQKAAATYGTISGGEQDQERKKALLWQTAELYEKAGNDQGAIKTYTDYAAQYGEPLEQSVEARQRVADIYKKSGNTKERNNWLAEIIKANDAGPATDRTRFLAAGASMELAEPLFEAYKSAHLVQPLKENLKKKKQLLKDCIDAYTKAADYGVEAITTEATYRIAEIYNDFSRGLFASERPAGLSSAELEQYDLLLEEQAFPFEEKAIEIHETNAGRVKDGVYDQWVKKSFLALRKLRPVRYAKLERSELFDSVFE